MEIAKEEAGSEALSDLFVRLQLEFSFGGWHVCQSSALVSPSFFEVVPACPTDIPAAFFTKTSVISLKAQL